MLQIVLGGLEEVSGAMESRERNSLHPSFFGEFDKVREEFDEVKQGLARFNKVRQGSARFNEV